MHLSLRAGRSPERCYLLMWRPHGTRSLLYAARVGSTSVNAAALSGEPHDPRCYAVAEMFSPDLERRALRASNGEFGWSRDDARLVVQVLAQHRQAILGGELWWVPPGAAGWTGLIPQRARPPGVYPWETTRQAEESWDVFIARCAQDSLSAIDRWPGADDLPLDLEGRLLYNLTGVSEIEFQRI